MAENGNRCSNCGTVLPVGHAGRCPACGFDPSVPVIDLVSVWKWKNTLKFKHKDAHGKILAEGKTEETTSGVTGYDAVNQYVFDGTMYVQRFTEFPHGGPPEVTHSDRIPKKVKPSVDWLQKQYVWIARSMGVARPDRKHATYDERSKVIFLEVGQSKHLFRFPLAEVNKARSGNTLETGRVRAALTNAAKAAD